MAQPGRYSKSQSLHVLYCTSICNHQGLRCVQHHPRDAILLQRNLCLSDLKMSSPLSPEVRLLLSNSLYLGYSCYNNCCACQWVSVSHSCTLSKPQNVCLRADFRHVSDVQQGSLCWFRSVAPYRDLQCDLIQLSGPEKVAFPIPSWKFLSWMTIFQPSGGLHSATKAVFTHSLSGDLQNRCFCILNSTEVLHNHVSSILSFVSKLTPAGYTAKHA